MPGWCPVQSVIPPRQGEDRNYIHGVSDRCLQASMRGGSYCNGTCPSGQEMNNMDINIYTNHERTEFAIARTGDQTMRARTQIGIHYPICEGSFDVTAASDLAFIDEDIQEALELHVTTICGCSENTEMECSICDGSIELGESHNENVLFAGDIEIGMIDAYHEDCA